MLNSVTWQVSLGKPAYCPSLPEGTATGTGQARIASGVRAGQPRSSMADPDQGPDLRCPGQNPGTEPGEYPGAGARRRRETGPAGADAGAASYRTPSRFAASPERRECLYVSPPGHAAGG